MLPDCSLRYEYPNQCARAPVLPGILLLFSEEILIHVSVTANLHDELSTKGPRHHQATHFTCEIIFDKQWRTARAAKLAQLLTPRLSTVRN